MRPRSLRCRLVRWMVIAWVAACAAAPPRRASVPDAPVVPADAERHYAIWLGGAQVGTARETEQWSRAGVVVRRTEVMRFLRGDVPVTLATTIEITANGRLAPSRVIWTEQAQALRHGEAVHDATGWTVTDEAGARRLPEDAIPAELAPLRVRRDGRFLGPVFLPARGFVAGVGRIDPVAPRRLVARLVLDGGTAEATIDLGDDAMPVRVVDGEGVIAIRLTAAEAATPFAPVDLIAATSIPLAGTPSHRLALEGDLALPPLPGQAARVAPGGVALELSARLPGSLPPGPRGADRTREIAALVARVRRRIAPDLAAHPSSARTAAAATAGDCTTFALAYAALAGDRAIPTRLVTGFRVDGDRLVRHRWTVSWTGRAWIAVDAAFGAVPAGGDLVGLAIHDADDVGLVAGEAALTHLRAAAWR
jgi:Transglutaminase-like superfamily